MLVKKVARGRYWTSVWAVLILATTMPVLYATHAFMHANFYQVTDEPIYRSGQPTGDELRAFITKYGIRSVINLRGTNHGSGWYEDEVRVTQELGAVHYDYAISANRELSDEEIAKILDIMRQAPKPILIHCKSGADRTSLIAALYLFSQGRSAEEASAQFSILYGHFPYFGNSTAAMDRTFWRYVLAHASRPTTPVGPSDE